MPSLRRAAANTPAWGVGHGLPLAGLLLIEPYADDDPIEGPRSLSRDPWHREGAERHARRSSSTVAMATMSVMPAIVQVRRRIVDSMRTDEELRRA